MSNKGNQTKRESDQSVARRRLADIESTAQDALTSWDTSAYHSFLFVNLVARSPLWDDGGGKNTTSARLMLERYLFWVSLAFVVGWMYRRYIRLKWNRRSTQRNIDKSSMILVDTASTISPWDMNRRMLSNLNKGNLPAEWDVLHAPDMHYAPRVESVVGMNGIIVEDAPVGASEVEVVLFGEQQILMKKVPVDLILGSGNDDNIQEMVRTPSLDQPRPIQDNRIPIRTHSLDQPSPIQGNRIPSTSAEKNTFSSSTNGHMDKLRSARPTSDNGTGKVEVHSFLFKTDGDWMSDDTDGSDDNKDADGSDDMSPEGDKHITSPAPAAEYERFDVHVNVVGDKIMTHFISTNPVKQFDASHVAVVDNGLEEAAPELLFNNDEEGEREGHQLVRKAFAPDTPGTLKREHHALRASFVSPHPLSRTLSRFGRPLE